MRIAALNLIGVVLVAWFAPTVTAHPVPRRYYDRTIAVRLTPSRVIVDYRLDVDVWTVYDDLGEFSKEVDLPSFTKPEQFCAAFNDSYGPILAGNLVARLDGQELNFECVKKGYETRDESGQMLDHLRCELRFEAPWQPAGAKRHTFSFREANYLLDTGHVRLSLTSELPINLLGKTEPDEALKVRPDTELRPGDAEQLRTASALFVVRDPVPPEPAPPSPGPALSGTALAVSAAAAVFALAGLLFLGRQLRRFTRT